MRERDTHQDIHKYIPNKAEATSHRRELVARLRMRGLSMREIVDQLAEVLVNANSGKPFVLATIRDDCHALNRAWLESAAASTEWDKARVKQELQEVKRAGWAAKDFAIVLRALKQECDLLGLDAPTQINLNLLQKRAQEAAERLGMTADELLDRATRMVNNIEAEEEA